MIKYDENKESGTITCDECGKNEEFWARDFYELIEKAKELGWRCTKIATFWEHYCFTCRNL